MNGKIPSRVPGKTHEFYAALRDLLGIEALTRVHNCSRSQAYRYTEDPAVTESPSRNPMDILAVLFAKAAKAGHADLAVAGLRILAAPLGCEVVVRGAVVPDKDSLEAECLDDIPVLGKLHQAITNGAPLAEVEKIADDMHREIDENVEACRAARAKGEI